MTGGKLYVPKVYAPLRPGSIYPDRKVPEPAKGRPALVVVCPEKGDCRKDEILGQAAQRGLFVLLVPRPDRTPPKDDLLRTLAGEKAEHFGWLLVEPAEDFLRRWNADGARGAAVAILLPARPAASGMAPRSPSGTAFPSYPSQKILFATLPSATPPAADDGTVLKLYAPDAHGRLPREALRDAVEWLAGELGAR